MVRGERISECAGVIAGGDVTGDRSLARAVRLRPAVRLEIHFLLCNGGASRESWELPTIDEAMEGSNQTKPGSEP